MDDKERLIKVEEQTRVNTEKIKEHSDLIKELSKTYSIIETMVLRLGNVEKNVESINEKLDKHEEQIQEEDKKGIKSKADILDYIFKGILTILLSYLAYKIGLK